MESKTQCSAQGRSGYSADDRRELIAEFRSSGLTQAAFCRQWELNPTTFSGWLRTDREQTPPVTFCEVQVPAAVLSRPIVIELSGGVQVRIPCESAGSFSSTLKEVAACGA
jgi:transposase-like protein